MDAQALKVALLGYGRIARLVHLGVLTALPDVELVAVAEPDPERRAEARARAPNARSCERYEQALDVPGVEAVVVCLPNDLHADAAVAALELGKHLYLEKPLATSLDDGRRVVAAWRRAGVVAMMGFNYRAHPLYEAAREHIRSGRLGDLVAVRTALASPPRDLPPWKRRRATGGGALLDKASHGVDLVRHLIGDEVREVLALLRTQHTEEDTAALQLRLGGGLLVQSLFSVGAAEDDRLEVYGSAGKLTVDRHESLALELSGAARGRRLAATRRELGALAGGTYALGKLRRPQVEPSYAIALARFAAAARANRPATPDLVDGLRSLAVIEAAEESARTRRAVAPSVVGADPVLA